MVALFLALKDCEQALRLKHIIIVHIGKLNDDLKKAGKPAQFAPSENHPVRPWSRPLSTGVPDLSFADINTLVT